MIWLKLFLVYCIQHIVWQPSKCSLSHPMITSLCPARSYNVVHQRENQRLLLYICKNWITASSLCQSQCTHGYRADGSWSSEPRALKNPPISNPLSPLHTPLSRSQMEITPMREEYRSVNTALRQINCQLELVCSVTNWSYSASMRRTFQHMKWHFWSSQWASDLS